MIIINNKRRRLRANEIANTRNATSYFHSLFIIVVGNAGFPILLFFSSKSCMICTQCLIPFSHYHSLGKRDIKNSFRTDSVDKSDFRNLFTRNFKGFFFLWYCCYCCRCCYCFVPFAMLLLNMAINCDK